MNKRTHPQSLDHLLNRFDPHEAGSLDPFNCLAPLMGFDDELPFELTAPNSPRYWLGLIVLAWYDGVAHLSRARSLLHQEPSRAMHLDRDANYSRSLGRFAAAREAWNNDTWQATHDIGKFDEGEDITLERHADSHILEKSLIRGRVVSFGSKSTVGAIHGTIPRVGRSAVEIEGLRQRDHQGGAWIERHVYDPFEQVWEQFWSEYISKHAELKGTPATGLSVEVLRRKDSWQMPDAHPYTRVCSKHCVYCLHNEISGWFQWGNR